MVRRLPRHVGLLVLGAAVVLLVVVSAQVLPEAVDWSTVYRPATLALLQGKSPYEIERVRIFSVFYNAPWTLLPLIPFALLPVELGRAALVLVAVAAFAYAALRLGAKLPGLAAFLLSPPVSACILHGNVDWMPVLGFAVPPRWGLFLVMVKPQMGFVVALFWLVEAWRSGGVRAVAETFAPVVVVTLISFVFFGLWPLDAFNTLDPGSESNSLAWNASLWPYTLPVGAALLVAMLKYREARFAMAAGPCLSPYVLLQAWSGALVSAVHLTEIMVATVLGLWALVIVRAMGGAL